MSNILAMPQQQAIQSLIAKGWSVRYIARTLGINRRTVKRYAAAASLGSGLAFQQNGLTMVLLSPFGQPCQGPCVINIPGNGGQGANLD
jgi:hypothetical protein